IVKSLVKAYVHITFKTCSKIAEEATGRRITANMVGLGLVVELTGVVSKGAIEAAVSARAPQGTEEMNLKALAAGLEKAEELKRSGD
ncbi:MAG: 2-oxoacid:acceptor oxidoreductase family protein, partial [Anaerolineae bacterium]